MIRKKITLELDAYEKLRRARQSPCESFSSVVRRAWWPDEGLTAGELLALVRANTATGATSISEDILDRLDEAQAQARRSDVERESEERL